MGPLFYILFVALLCQITQARPLEDAEFEAYKKKHPAEFGKHFEGDMLIDSTFRNGIMNSSRKWPGGVIPYELDMNSVYHYDEGFQIKKAISRISRFTCVRWVPRRHHHTSWVKIHRGDGCSSIVGMHSKDNVPQTLSLGDGCLDSATITHEMLHAMGFVHEHSRTDRDDYITVDFNNVEKDMRYNFDKHGPDYISSMDTRYDYDSLMHYGRKAFSMNGKDTIIPKDPNAQIGDKVAMSMTDIERVNKMYCQ